MLLLGILALANPVMVREQRQPLGDIVSVLVDRTPSQTINQRPQQVETALKELSADLGSLDDVQVVETSVAGGKGGTRLFEALATSLAEIDRSRLAAVVILSDGQVHDVPSSLGAPGLPCAAAPAVDRRAGRAGPPPGGRAGAELRHGRRAAGADLARRGPAGAGRRAGDRHPQAGRRGARAPDRDARRRAQAAVRAHPRRPDRARGRGRGGARRGHGAQQPAGVLRQRRARPPARPAGVGPALPGPARLAQPAEGRSGGRSRAFHHPAAAGEAGRHADPRAGADRVSLARAVRGQAARIRPGDLRPLLAPRAAAARLSRQRRPLRRGGGALLEVAGPEFAHPLSLYRTPLARVLPGRPSGVVYERGFTPALTETGNRHPVTGGLEAAWSDGDGGRRAAVGALVPPYRRRGGRPRRC